jgi:hypothetical protein
VCAIFTAIVLLRATFPVKSLRALSDVDSSSQRRKPMKTNDSAKALSRKLYSYMQFRAAREGVAYGLNPKFFLENLKRGIRRFFGVVCSGGELVRDEQQPTIFAKWNERRAVDSLA